MVGSCRFLIECLFLMDVMLIKHYIITCTTVLSHVPHALYYTTMSAIASIDTSAITITVDIKNSTT